MGLAVSLRLRRCTSPVGCVLQEAHSGAGKIWKRPGLHGELIRARRASFSGHNVDVRGTRRRDRTRKCAIAAYWLGEADGGARLPGNAARIDPGEPSCFACGWMAVDADATPVLWDVWEEAMLQRCHLVPHALGGPDSPANLVLLCGRCHGDAPDVGDADYMLRWIERREPWGCALAREINEALEGAGLREANITQCNELVAADPHEFESRMNQLMRDWAVPVAGSFSTASLAACSTELIRRWIT